MTQPDPFPAADASRRPLPYSTGSRTDLVGDRSTSDELGAAHDRVRTAGAMIFLPFLVLFCAGLWLLGDGFERGSGWLFGLGILMCGASFLIPLSMRND